MTGPLAPSAGEVAAGVTLDALFRSSALARPDALALADAGERASLTDGSPRRLTYAEADAAVGRLAAHLQSLDLPPGSVVAVQLPAIVEAAVALLAILRAGLVAAPLPMAWRHSELVAALAGIEPRAFVTLARFGDERPAQAACEAAADLFSLSFPCAFGADLPDGVIALDGDEPTAPAVPPAPSLVEQAAIVTFDAAADGFFAAGRGHGQWLALGLATLLEARIESGDRIVSALAPNSLAGIGAGFVPWLLSGGALEFNLGLPRGGAADKGRTHLVAPAAAVAEFARRSGPPLASAIAVQRLPHGRSPDLSAAASEHAVDVTVFGELGATALRRTDRGRPQPVPLGPISAPSHNPGAITVIETALEDGEVLLRGPMLAGPFPASAPFPRADGRGFVRTGYRGRSDGKRLMFDAGPARVATVGGLRFGLDDLEKRIAKHVADAKVATTGDPLLGERLRIEVNDPAAAVAALRAGGFSPLVIEAVAVPLRRRAAG